MNSSQLTTLRNELYDMLPTGKVEAWDMITAVKAMFERFDQVIDQQPSSSGVESAGVKQLLEDFLDYVGGNYTQHGTGDDVYWDRGEGEDRQMNYEGVVEDYLFDYSEFADAVLSLTKSFSAVESAGVWVKASERLPAVESYYDDPPKYILKCKNDGSRGDRDVYYQDAASIREICKNYDYCEWLDESAAVLPSNSRCAALYLKAIQDFELPDIDAPVFTHTQQFRQHFDYIKKHFIVYLESLNKKP